MTAERGKNTKFVAYTVLMLAAILVPFVITDNYTLHLIIVSLVWACVVTNWNLTLGYGGMFHIAQPTFLAVGGYTAAISAVNYGVSPWICLLIGGFGALAASVIVGACTSSSSGRYLTQC